MFELSETHIFLDYKIKTLIINWILDGTIYQESYLKYYHVETNKKKYRGKNSYYGVLRLLQDNNIKPRFLINGKYYMIKQKFYFLYNQFVDQFVKDNLYLQDYFI